MSRTDELEKKFKERQASTQSNKYSTAGEVLSVEDKLKILEQRGQTDLIDIFKDWKPRVSTRKRKGAPLDQRVSIAITPAERAMLDGELKAIKETGKATSLGALIRSRAMGTPNVTEWREIAWKELDNLTEIINSEKELKKRKSIIEDVLENEEDEEQVSILEKELYEIKLKLGKLATTPGEKRSVRLQGRMTYAEAEQVKWRAQRLCLSTTDYLRMLIFDLNPVGISDQHLNLDARRRFYVSIAAVADDGFQAPPGVHQCSQCESYADEIARLNERIKLAETFS